MSKKDRQILTDFYGLPPADQTLIREVAGDVDHPRALEVLGKYDKFVQLLQEENVDDQVFNINLTALLMKNALTEPQNMRRI